MPSPQILVPRPRLTSALAGATVAVVEAGGGYGKTTLARELAEELGIAGVLVELTPSDVDGRALLARCRVAFRRAGLTDLADAVSDPSADPGELVDDLLRALAREQEPVLVTVDDAHHLREPDAGAVLSRLADALTRPHRLILLTRRVRDPLSGVAIRPGTVHLGARELAFTDTEVAALVGGQAGGVGADGAAPGIVQAILRASAGWPAAASLLVDELTDDAASIPELEADRPALLSRLLDERLGGLRPDQRMAMRQLALLPLLSPSVVAEATGDEGLFDALVASGLPMTQAPGGWWRLPDPVRERLADPRPDVALARRAALAYAQRDEIELAIRVLVGAGLADDAAAHIAALTPHAVERLDVRTMRSLMRAISEVDLAAHPRAWLNLARACDAAADGTTRTEALTRAAAAPATSVDGPLRRELDAERARDLARDGLADEAEALARRVADSAGPDEQLTRVRALHTLGRVKAWRADASSLADAERLLDDVVRLYGDLGMPGWSAHAALSLAYHVLHPRGEGTAALARLDEALATLTGRQRLRAVLLTFKAEILIANGRAGDAVAANGEARSIGQALGDNRVLAYAAWNEARAASQAGDAQATFDRLAEVERHPGDWSAHLTGVEFLADAAVLADRVGLVDVAAGFLVRARVRRAEAEQAVLIAEAVVDARSGDPVKAEAAFEALATTSRLETRDRWWLTLMRAWAATRRGDPTADVLVGEAFRMAGAIDPSLPFVREPRVATELRARLAGDLAPHQPLLALRLLGTSELSRDGQPVAVPSGRPAAILEMTGLAGGLAVDEVIERLWPETDPETGRARLRNTLNRLREAIGPVVERHDETLRLAATVAVDARRYETIAREAITALRASGRETDRIAVARAIEAGRSAAGLYGGPVLPSRPFDDWAAEARERLSRLQLELFDRLAVAAERDGDVDDAIRMRRAGITLDPDDEVRYVALARLLLGQGRRGPARAALDAGAAALRALGLPPTPEIEALRATIGRAPDARPSASKA